MFNLVVTAGRAGSSFLALQLNKHPQVACLNETHYLPLLLDAFGGHRATPGEILRIVDQTRFHDGRNVLTNNFPALNIHDDAWVKWRSQLEQSCAALTVSEFHERLNAFVCTQTGAEIVIDKTPCYGAHLRAFEKYLGNLSVINLTRDFKFSVRSMLKHPGFLIKVRKRVNTWTDVLRYHQVTAEDMCLTLRPGEVGAMARLWAWRTTEPLRQKHKARITFANMRYEDMLYDSEAFFQGVRAFYGIAEDENWISQCKESVNVPTSVETQDYQPKDTSPWSFLRGGIVDELFSGRSESLERIERLPAVVRARSEVGYR